MKRLKRLAPLLIWVYLLLTLLPAGGRVLCMRPLAEPRAEWSDWQGHCACGAGDHGHQALTAAERIWSVPGCFDLRLGGERARLQGGGFAPLKAHAADQGTVLPNKCPASGISLGDPPVGWGHAPPRSLPSSLIRQALMGIFLC